MSCEGLKIAHFHTTLPQPGRKLGGVEVAVHRLAEAQVELGAVVTVYSLTPSPNSAKYKHVRLFPQSAWLHQKRLARLFLLPFLLNKERFGNSDIIHFHGDDWFYMRRRKGRIRTMHGSALNEARSASSLKRRFAQYLVYPLERLSAILAKRVLAVGPDAASIYATPYIVGNGVDTDLFKPDIKISNPTILFVGTWEGRKRGKFLFELFTKKVLPILPQARLTMVSDTCDEHPSVDFVKFPTDEVLATLYGKAWVFAYPSLYEGFGIAYLEAMASGTAVIATKNPGAEYVLDAGRYAIISEDISFGSDLIELLSNEELRSGYVEQGILRAQEFTWKAVAENHCVHYREILGNSKS